MAPLYQDGDFVLIAKFPFLFFKVQKKVVFNFKNEVYIKEITKVEKDYIQVKGLSPYSMKESEFGQIKKKDVIGIVLKHFA